MGRFYNPRSVQMGYTYSMSHLIHSVDLVSPYPIIHLLCSPLHRSVKEALEAVDAPAQGLGDWMILWHLKSRTMFSNPSSLFQQFLPTHPHNQHYLSISSKLSSRVKMADIETIYASKVCFQPMIYCTVTDIP